MKTRTDQAGDAMPPDATRALRGLQVPNFSDMSEHLYLVTTIAPLKQAALPLT
jgi:hypothetical protein